MVVVWIALGIAIGVLLAYVGYILWIAWQYSKL